MAIFQAVGLGITIIVLYLLVPPIYHAIVDTTVLFLQVAQDALELARASITELSVYVGK